MAVALRLPCEKTKALPYIRVCVRMHVTVCSCVSLLVCVRRWQPLLPTASRAEGAVAHESWFQLFRQHDTFAQWLSKYAPQVLCARARACVCARSHIFACAGSADALIARTRGRTCCTQ